MPLIVSSLTIISDTCLLPTTYFLTDSTIAVAADLSPIIVLPTKSDTSPITANDLKTFSTILPNQHYISGGGNNYTINNGAQVPYAYDMEYVPSENKIYFTILELVFKIPYSMVL